jgi:hypothetical protein
MPTHNELFDTALREYDYWEFGTPEPTIEIETDEGRANVTLSRAFRKLLDCSDELPDIYRNKLGDRSDPRPRTYGEAARILLANVKVLAVIKKTPRQHFRRRWSLRNYLTR